MKFVGKIEELEPLRNQEKIVIPVLSDPNKHWSQNRISFIYFYLIRTFEEYIVGINHNDTCGFEIRPVLDFLSEGDYVYKKKFLSQENVNLSEIWDVEMLHWFQTNQKLVPETFPVIRDFQVQFKEIKNINDSIPIMKWLDHCRDIKDRFLSIYNGFEVTEPFIKYNQFLDDLSEIEKNGIGNEFCEYNPFTLTGRPSNHFNGINYAALNKTDGSRKRFISRHEKGLLIEIDLSGFHLYLIYLILGEPFPENIYAELSKFYPNDVNPKEFTFKQIYGGIDQELREVEPFKSILRLEQEIFLRYKTNSLKTFLFDRKIDCEILKGFNQSKVFNYMLQNLETEFNSMLIQKINQFLKEKETKLILYTYDSFLFDFSFKDGKETLDGIKEIFDGIPYHLKVGINYHEMKNK